MGKAIKKIAGLAIGSALSAITGGKGVPLAFSWSSFAISLILGGLSYALTPKEKKPSFDASSLNNIGNSTTAVRQSNMTRQNVYGHTRVTRGYAHMQSTGLNGTLHMILILCQGELRAINEIWVNDYVIPQDWIDSEGNITQGRYAGFMTIRKHLGGQYQEADSKAVTNMEGWTTDHRLQGISYLYITMTKNQDVYPTGVPNISAIVEGKALYDPRVDDNVWSTNIALYANDFLKNSEYGFSAFDDDIDNVNVSAQANICDEIVDTEALPTVATSVNDTTDIITLSGDVLLYQFGDRVNVSSTGTLPGGLSSSDDYYIIPYQVSGTPRIMLANSLTNSMNKSQVDITSAGSGTLTITKTGEPRYHGGGVFDTEKNLSETMNDICSSMAGRAVCIGGFWTLLAGAWRSPDIELGIDDVRGNGISFKNSMSMSDSFNIVKGLFISSINQYQSSDYPSAQYLQFIEQDNNLESPKEINLPFTNRPTTAQRIAKIELFRGRQEIVFNSDFSLAGLQVQPGDTIELNIDRLGWANKFFELTEFSFDVANGNLITRMTVRETAQAIYDWSQGEAIDYDPAPNTNLPNPFLVQVPSGVSYNSRIADTSGGETLYIMQMMWDSHPDAFVQQFGDFELQFRKSADTEWLPSFFVDGTLTQSDLFTSQIGVPYDLRIRARNNLGVRSNWVTILGAIVGSSGGVGTTEDWETFTDPEVYYRDWGLYSEPIGSGDYEDWGYFT